MAQRRRPSQQPKPETNRDYDVGYGRTPVHTRWVKGQSGNPRGPGKRLRSIGAAADKALRSTVGVVDQTGRRRSISAEDMIMRRFRDAALNGDVRAATFLFDRAERHRADQPAKAQEAGLSSEDIEILESLLDRKASSPKARKPVARENTQNLESAARRRSP